MRIFKNRHVARLTRKVGVDDTALRRAAERAAAGLIDANLGKFLIKQRVPRLKGGKSGGFRAILFYRAEDMAVILYLFAKNERENLTAQELNIYRDVAQSIGRMTRRDVEQAIADEKWIEI